jgi:hypothetical protein
VRRSNGESISPELMQQTTKHPVKKIFWGYFPYYSNGPLVPIDGRMNSNRYKTLITRTVPEL